MAKINVNTPKLNLSIGIPAFNEEGNIAHLINSVLAQRQSSFNLLEIIVIADGSQDKTVSIVRKFKNPRIKLVVGKKRLGQQFRQNQILKLYKGDVLIILEADILLYNDRSLGELVKPFLRKKFKKLGMVVGIPIAVKPKTFLEKILYHGSHLKTNVFKHWKNGKNLYVCGGHSMKALSRDFTKKLSWPKDVPEDAYTYLRLRDLGFDFFRNPKAKAYMRNTAKFKDRLKQVRKFVNGKKALKKYFPQDIIRTEYEIPLVMIIKYSIWEFLKNPIWTMLYFLEFAVNRFLTIKTGKFSYLYEPYGSTKTLIDAPQQMDKQSKRMKIAILDMDNLKNPFWAAGQARATREVGKRLAQKHEVTVYCSKYPGYQDYAEDGIKYVHVGLNCQSSRLTNLAFIFILPFLVRKIKADIIVENFNAPTSVSFAPLFTKTPIIGLPTMFNAYEFTKKYHLPFHWAEKFGLRFYKYMMPYSETDSQKIERLNPKIIYKIIPQGVSDEFFEIKHKTPKYILFLGRLDIWQKGIDLLLDAYAKAAPEIDLPLVIAGHGPDEKKLRELIKRLKLEKSVKMIGPTYGRKKIEIISEALFVAFPSRHDEISLWALEALASGLPIVGFDLPECAWMSKKVALKADPFDTNEYANLLVKATDRKIIQKMRIESRKFAKKYNWDKVAYQFESFFRYVLKNELSK